MRGNFGCPPASGDRIGVGVMMDGAQLPGQVCGGEADHGAPVGGVLRMRRVVDGGDGGCQRCVEFGDGEGLKDLFLRERRDSRRVRGRRGPASRAA